MNKPAFHREQLGFVSLFLAFIVVAANSSDRPLFKIIALVLVILVIVLGIKILRDRT
ncbi:hypothetical protein [Lentilactobacillus sp. SPB1-3]|uniref:Uncharacterized protein n=1 Tax=Lentilactobacillus terminaliae TaxID=3003483 RepID=A0ACD5DEV4_9LACO|nr:hypothetical protein [Lentilactobacillus sp. SPB1-3]MCZ0977698.1 hypothetical protein [Lentilactobacillus sp. SPB1-3]